MFHGDCTTKRKFLIVNNRIDDDMVEIYNEKHCYRSIIKHWFNTRTSLLINMNASYKDSKEPYNVDNSFWKDFKEQILEIEDIL